ncbi:hypothetical protein OIU84_023351 [Salix udensis]|uniref:Uncharacterized protein n=1 Tax=Salix udensis TaxID=889485 RepID=A0AAD6KQV9_9ROSI|nr:hypothetical protein OIU84_023351 [Salix udensis]
MRLGESAFASGAVTVPRSRKDSSKWSPLGLTQPLTHLWELGREGGGARDNHSSSATEVLVDNLNGACAYLSFYPWLLDRVCLVNALG